MRVLSFEAVGVEMEMAEVAEIKQTAARVQIPRQSEVTCVVGLRALATSLGVGVSDGRAVNEHWKH